MMTKVLLTLLLIPAFGIGQELANLRMEYPKANSDATITATLFETLSATTTEDDAILVAYKGAVLTLKAKHSRGIKHKKEFFKQGVELLEYAIKIVPKNIEIRCLRLGVQENSPRIVGYKNNIQEDKQFLLDNYKAITDTEIQKFVKGYIRLSKAFSDSEKQLF